MLTWHKEILGAWDVNKMSTGFPLFLAVSVVLTFFHKEESPPTWAQEAYHLRRIITQLSCRKGGGGEYPCPGWGVPIVLIGERGYLSWPGGEVPSVLAGVPPSWQFFGQDQRQGWDQRPGGTPYLPPKRTWHQRPGATPSLLLTNKQTSVKTLPSLSFGCGR